MLSLEREIHAENVFFEVKYDIKKKEFKLCASIHDWYEHALVVPRGFTLNGIWEQFICQTLVSFFNVLEINLWKNRREKRRQRKILK